MTVARSWDRIFAWYDANTLPGTLVGNRGATERQLADLEALVGTRLPDDFRESYRLLDGTRGRWLLYHGWLLSLAEIADQWQTCREWQAQPEYGKGPAYQPRQLESPEIKPVWWTPLRVPITANGGGDHDMLDLDPAAGGTRGQVIHFSHEVGPVNLLVGPRRRRRRADQPSLWDDGDEADPGSALGTGMAGWLAQIADELESGVHAYSESSQMVCPVAWGRR
ncbi:MAG: SMI1/KNR4 family protein [Zavarzinella sp.]|nr:SMI1/KNR4 family protein [Zavarzinella sp.]